MTTETTESAVPRRREKRDKPDGKTLAIRGVVWTAATRIVSRCTTFFVTPVLLLTLGLEQYGIWSILMALTGYYGLVNMGIGKANTKYIAQYDAVNDTESVCAVMSTGLALFSALAVVVLCVAGAVAWYFPVVFNIGGHSTSVARWIVMLMGVKVAVGLIGQVFTAGIRARKRFDLTCSIETVSLILRGGLIILIVLSGGGLLEMALTVVALAVLGNVITFFLAMRVVGLPRPTRSAVSRATGKTLFRFGLLSFVVQFARRISTYGGSLILGIVSGPAVVGVYSVAESLTRKGLHLGKSINGVVMPFASQFDAQANRNALTELLFLPTRLLLCLAFLLAMVLLAMGNSFLELWISPEIATLAFPILSVLCLSLLVKMPTNGMQSILEGMGKLTFLSRVAVAEGIAVLVFAAILTPRWGALGMAWAVLAAQLLFSGLTLPIYVCRVLNVSIIRLFVNSAVPAFASVMPALLLTIVFVQLFPVDSLLLLLLQMSLVTAVAGLSAYWFCLDSSIRANIFVALLPRMRNRRNLTLVTPEGE